MSKGTAEEVAIRRIRAVRKSGGDVLDLSGLELPEVPSEIVELTSLQTLYLTNNQISSLPSEIGQLTNLQALYLTNNQISSLPSEIGQVTSLQTLDLTNNQISSLPSEIGQLTSLQTLDLRNNRISSLPSEIGQLTSLQTLDLTNNQISSLPSEIGQLTSLQTLDLMDNKLSSLPSEIGQLMGLQSLGLMDNQLSLLPAATLQLTGLQSLDLMGNRLSSLPAGIGRLASLKSLDLMGNNISSLPTEIGQLTGLQSLDLRKNQISSLPSEIGQLTSLQTLFLTKNQISSLPSEIGQLTSLQTLFLTNNQISSLPSEIGQLTSLQTLSLRDNQLERLPPEVGMLSALVEVALQGNSPFLDRLQELADRGIRNFKAYLASFLDGEQLYESKLLLIGEGGVGKSTLLGALQGERFQEGRSSTHGIEVKHLELPHRELDTSIHLHAWDFGGQEHYRISHQFFYSPRSLYLLLWEPQRGHDGCEVEQWVERIKLRVGGDARILIVATHCDTANRDPVIDKAVLLRDHGNVIHDFFEVDSQTGRGIEGLKKAMAEEAARLPQMGEWFSKRWQAVREELRGWRETRRHSSFPDFEALCQQHNLEAVEVHLLLEDLHRLGDVIAFQEDEGLQEEIVLDPEWLSKAISLILEDRETREASGVLDHRRLSAVWEHHGQEGEPKYGAQLHPFLLRLMEKYDVSYRLENIDGSLVAQLVPEIRPDLPWTADTELSDSEEGQVSLICEMAEIPPGLVPWMIVRTHLYAHEPRLQWRKGSFLDYEEHGTALLELRDQDLFLTVRAEWPQYFLSILRHTLTHLIDNRWPGLRKQFKVPCRGEEDGSPCSGRFPLQGLQKFKKKGIREIACTTCTEIWNVDELLTGFQGTDDLREEMREVRKVTRALASQAADQHLALLRALATETRECPRTFTLLPVEKEGWSRLRVGKVQQRLTVWCEHPDHPHPTCTIGSGKKDGQQGERGEYIFDKSAAWLRKVAPLANAVARTLKVLVPVGGAIVKAGVDEVLLADAKGKLDLMEKLTATLLHEVDDPGSAREESDAAQVDGAALRELFQVLVELDPKRTWGGLRRAGTATGDFLWLCPTHYKEFDPGIPVLPRP
jgi:internalin A